jgi:hypothetical protein
MSEAATFYQMQQFLCKIGRVITCPLKRLRDKQRFYPALLPSTIPLSQVPTEE